MKRFFPLLFLSLLITGLAYAGGSLRGVVTDKKSHEPMIGATVRIQNKKTGRILATGTGLDGTFMFKNVPTGSYEVQVKYISYKDAKKDAEVAEGTTSAVTFQLEDAGSQLREVAITARLGNDTEQAARRVEQRSDQVLNAVSSKTIEASPDITVANVTQRVSGVALERSSNGEGQYAIIRGMEKRYTYTLINGYKIPSPDNKTRYVPLDIFPADIIDRLEVYKSLTPSMEGDAIAGGINMVLKEAPDHFTVNANLGLGLSQAVMNNGYTKFGDNDVTVRSPRVNNGLSYTASTNDFSKNPAHYTNSKMPMGLIAGLNLGGRTNDKKLGALVSLSYQDNYKTTKSTFFGTDVDLYTNQPKLTSISARQYSTEQQRTGLVGRFDYRINDRNKLVLDAAYINLAQNQYRFTSDTDLVLQRTGIGQGRVKESPRSIRSVEQIANFSLHGDHRLAENLSVNWTGVYSKATDNENRYQLNLVTSRTLQPGGNVTQEPLTVDASGAYDATFAYNTDEDKSGYLNFVYVPKIFDTKVEFSAGGMYRDKSRNSTFDDYTLRLAAPQNYTGVDNLNFDPNVINAQGTPFDPLNYTFSEKVGAGYGQFKFTAGRIQATGGVRYEHTSQSWVDALPETFNGKTGDIKYRDLLPSFILKYNLTDNQSLHATYYAAISRPNFYELVPHVSGDPDADYLEYGNPNLKPARADNYDLRYEFFPKGFDQLLAGVFYKRIVDPIEYALVPSSSAKDLVLEAGNFGTARNYGFELDATKYINKFGFRANYSFTQSDITTPKQERYRDAAGNTQQRTVDQTRPLQGQSKHLGNLSLLYKDIKTGLDAQVSAVYTGERINSVSNYLNNDIWQKAFVTLDVSAEKKITKHLFVYAKATNLLNTPYQLFIKQAYPQPSGPNGGAGATGQVIEYQEAGKNTFVRKDNYLQYYILGVHYKF
ncbi:TonB-dependent receptor [Mucilaginibacter yixingensis]|uniref:TonB-dependent receptor n=1 Tax=Mucilaginibacter yixingensis TaxID=1295612 RepID=A0A2T5JCB9_9SPHI|nr:TonB-dependent receptor [Mucilaginibacter yixingensis]PTQ99417.1 TonB-dependent receptor [Mucilaginibacter yixingensis]